MPSLAAREFRQRAKEYKSTDDGLNFSTWYHVQDVQRLIWKKYSQLEPKLKRDTLQPFVFFDGLDQLTLESMLSPLISILKKSQKKYFPFIFKPELAGAHYIAGFLRKNKNETVCIIFFNPTGTRLRVDYGSFDYAFSLADPQSDESDFDENTLYFKIDRGTLYYSVKDSHGVLRTNSLSPQFLKELKIELDLNKPLTTELIRDLLKPKAAQILELTLERKETEKKIEIISSSKKIQTYEKDKGELVSCGPLSIIFIEYLMNHPEYMEGVDKEFNLPEILNLEFRNESLIQQFLASKKNKDFDLQQFLDAENNEDFSFPDFVSEIEKQNLIEYKKSVLKYRQLMIKVRQEHYQVLDSIEDTFAETGGGIDESYTEITEAILNSQDSKEDEELIEEENWKEDEYLLENWDNEESEISSTEEESKQMEEIKSSILLNPVSSQHEQQIAVDMQPQPIETKPIETTNQKEQTEIDTRQKKIITDLNPENREDVKFIRSQIVRFRENAKSICSINNESKAKAIEQALMLALQEEKDHGVRDVRADQRVKDALAIHRIFGFFGCKSTTATIELERSFEHIPLIR